MSTKPLIFVDIDGVFIPAGEGGECFRESALESFRALVDAVSADVIITSTRRLVAGVEYFRRQIHAAVIGVTPECGTHLPRARHLEISEVRDRLGCERPWIAIDDQSELYPASCRNLILVDPQLLFNDDYIRHALRVLESQGMNPKRLSRGAA